jgi:HK97 family phage portal protein
MGGDLMGLRNALKLLRGDAEYRASADAVPLGAPRPSMTMWYDPGGMLPPVSWAPYSGEFETHWDWAAWSAMHIPGVWRARMLISQSIGGMPLGAWKQLEQVTPVPPILAEPRPGEDRANTVAAWVCDLLDHGNAIGVVTAWNAEAKPTSVEPVRCTEVEIGRTEPGRVYYKIGGAVYDASQIFHAKGTCLPGDLRGVGVLEAGLATLERVRAESAYATKAFNSGMPAGLLHVKDPDLQVGTDDDEPGYVTAKGIKKAWMSSVATGDIAVLSDLVDFVPLSWTPTDAQMIEARTLSLTDIGALYNLDGYWLGAPSAPMVYQNVQQAALQLSRFTLGFWITALEAQFSRMLPRGTEARFNRDTLLRDDQTTQIDNGIKLLDAGAWSTNEFRLALGLPPLPDDTPATAPVVALLPGGNAATNEAVNQ